MQARVVGSVRSQVGMTSLADKLAHTEREQERRVLPRHPHALRSQPRRQLVQVFAVEEHPSRDRLQVAARDLEQSGFA